MKKQTVKDIINTMKLFRSTKELIIVENKTGEVLNASENFDRIVKFVNNDSAYHTIVAVK